MTKRPERFFVNSTQIDPHLFCSICNEVYEDPHSTPCKHTFCFVCIVEWISQSKTCPLCRGQFMMSELSQEQTLIDQIKKLNSKCSHQRCQWTGKYYNLKMHQRACLLRIKMQPSLINQNQIIEIEEDEDKEEFEYEYKMKGHKKVKLNENVHTIRSYYSITIQRYERNVSQFPLLSSFIDLTIQPDIEREPNVIRSAEINCLNAQNPIYISDEDEDQDQDQGNMISQVPRTEQTCMVENKMQQIPKTEVKIQNTRMTRSQTKLKLNKQSLIPNINDLVHLSNQLNTQFLELQNRRAVILSHISMLKEQDRMLRKRK